MFDRMRTRKKQAIPPALRWHVWERDNFTCHYCGSREFLSIDHIVPESGGGTLHPDNLRTACRTCNSSKGTRHVEAFHFPGNVEETGNVDLANLVEVTGDGRPVQYYRNDNEMTAEEYVQVCSYWHGRGRYADKQLLHYARKGKRMHGRKFQRMLPFPLPEPAAAT